MTVPLLILNNNAPSFRHTNESTYYSTEILRKKRLASSSIIVGWQVTVLVSTSSPSISNILTDHVSVYVLIRLFRYEFFELYRRHLTLPSLLDAHNFHGSVRVRIKLFVFYIAINLAKQQNVKTN